MDIFGAKFNKDLIQGAVNRSNTDYGGGEIQVTKVVFPNGSIDPWHALGITEDVSDNTTAVFIEGRTNSCFNTSLDRNICLYTLTVLVRDRTICLQKRGVFPLLPRGGT